MSRRVLLVVWAAVLAAVPAAGCRKKVAARTAAGPSPVVRVEKSFHTRAGGAATPDQEAVAKVLDADREQFRAIAGGVHSDSQPSQVAAAYSKYHDHLKAAELGPTPPDFRAAFERYRRAVGVLHRALSRLPDSFAEDEFTVAFLELIHGETDKSPRLGGDVAKGVGEMTTALAKLYKSAEECGLEPDR